MQVIICTLAREKANTALHNQKKQKQTNGAYSKRKQQVENKKSGLVWK